MANAAYLNPFMRAPVVSPIDGHVPNGQKLEMPLIVNSEHLLSGDAQNQKRDAGVRFRLERSRQHPYRHLDFFAFGSAAPVTKFGLGRS